MGGPSAAQLKAEPRAAGRERHSAPDSPIGRAPHRPGEAALRLAFLDGSPGRPLAPTERARWERRLGGGLGDVRLHTGGGAAAAAEQLGAHAFTRGSDVYFGSQRYDPGSRGGVGLIAHELAHVVQQRRAAPASSAGALERAADRASDDVAAGRTTRVHGAARRGSIQRQPRTKAVEVPRPQLPRSTLLELALARLEAPELENYGWMVKLRAQLHQDLQTPAGPDEPQLRERAESLTGMLHTVEPKLKALAALAEPKNYLPELQSPIRARVDVIQRGYVDAIFLSYNAEGLDERILENADSMLKEFPAFVIDQYLGPNGIQSLVAQLPEYAGKIRALRSKSDNGPRPIDKIVGLGAEGTPLGSEWDLMRDIDLARGEWAEGRDVEKATAAIQTLTARAQLMVGAMTALALFEQFSYWRQELQGSIVGTFIDIVDDEPFQKALKYEYQYFYAILASFERATIYTADPEMARVVNESALEDLAWVVGLKDFQRTVDLIQDRLETIATVNIIATVIVITAAAALTAGAAGTLAAGLAEVAGGGALAIGAAEFGAGALAFTIASREGQEIAFGKAEGSFGWDFATNLLMFGVLKGAGKVFEAAFKLGPEAGAAARASYGLGKAATSLIALEGFAEGEHLVKEGEFMSGDELARSFVQNLTMMIALSAGRFITDPIEKRITSAIGAKLRPAFVKRLEAIETERADLKALVDALPRAAADDRSAAGDVMKRTEALWKKELKLLEDGVRRKAITPDELKVALQRYDSQIAALELQLARLDISARFGSGKQVFRPIEPGVVSFAPEGESTLRMFYAEQRGVFERSPKFAGVYEGRLGGELTYYVPEGEAFRGAPEAARVAGSRDRALRAAAADPKAKLGLENLTKMFEALKADEVLAAPRPEDLRGFLRALADPEAAGFDRPEFYSELARRPTAIAFAERYGTRALQNLAGQYSWDVLVKEVLPHATAQIEKAAPTERAALLDALRTEIDTATLDALLGRRAPAAAAFDALPPLEKAIATEAQAILESPEFAELQRAQQEDRSIEISVGGRTIIYQADLPRTYNAMTLQPDGFALGPAAFVSRAEVIKTLLHELHRLHTTKSQAQGASAALATRETADAFEFAEQTYARGQQLGVWPAAPAVPAGGGGGPGGRPRTRALLIGPERADEFAWADELLTRGADVVAVNPSRTPEADAFAKRGGVFHESRVEDLPADQQFDVMSEDFPFPSAQHLGAAQEFLRPRIGRLAPRGDFFLLTEDTNFASALQAAATLRGDVDVTEYPLPTAHETTPHSPWLRERTRVVLVFRKR